MNIKQLELRSRSKALSINYRALFVWGLAAAFFFAEYFARVAPSVMVPNLMSAFHVNALSLGALSAFFYYAYVGMQIPVGTLIDRYGPHKLLTLTALLCGIACFIFAESHQLMIADLARFLMGLAAAFAFVGALKLARTWFSPAKFGLLAGATQALGMLGAAVGEGPVSVLVHHAGWQKSMLLIGCVLILLSILIGCIVRDHPNPIASLPPKKYSLWNSILVVIKNKQCWLNGIFIGFLYAPTGAFAELWGASYLHKVYAINQELAASAIGAIFIGFAISSPCLGWVSDKIKKRKPIMLFSAVSSLILISAVLYIPNLSFVEVTVLLFLYGMSNVAVATSYALASEIVPSEVSATSMSFANMASVLIAALFQPIIGALLDYGWDHQMLHGAAVFSVHDYRTAMISLPLCSLVSIIAWIFIKESYQSNN